MIGINIPMPILVRMLMPRSLPVIFCKYGMRILSYNEIVAINDIDVIVVIEAGGISMSLKIFLFIALACLTENVAPWAVPDGKVT